MEGTGRPSKPDRDSQPGRYDENESHPAEDEMPGGQLRPPPRDSRAALRLRIEELLARREASPVEAWQELGEEGRAMLVELVDDVAIMRREALRQKLIATLGQLQVRRAVPKLGQILHNRSETALARTYAASALGNIGDRQAIPLLGAAVADKDDMVRRQVALALGRTRRPEAVPHLLKLQDDQAPHVVEAAAFELAAYERELGRKLGAKAVRKRAEKERTEPLPE